MFVLYPKTQWLMSELTFFGLLALDCDFICTTCRRTCGLRTACRTRFCGSATKTILLLCLWLGVVDYPSSCSFMASYTYDFPAGYSIIFCQSIAVILFFSLVHKKRISNSFLDTISKINIWKYHDKCR